MDTTAGHSDDWAAPFFASGGDGADGCGADGPDAARYGTDGDGGDLLEVRRIADTGTATARLVLVGELDRTSAALLSRFVAAAVRAPAPATLELDTRDVSFLDSSGIRCLWNCWKAADVAGTRLVVTDPSTNVYSVLEITEMLGQFGVPCRPDASPTGRSRQLRCTPQDPQKFNGRSAQLRPTARESRSGAAAPWSFPAGERRPGGQR
ncbi:MAG TPA: STAS domain-containing protein [Actinoplanes sp.]|nr:STAS domain-containing protein [Actinoplanes sp.]